MDHATNYIKNHYETQTDTEMANVLGISRSTVKRKRDKNSWARIAPVNSVSKEGEKSAGQALVDKYGFEQMWVKTDSGSALIKKPGLGFDVEAFKKDLKREMDLYPAKTYKAVKAAGQKNHNRLFVLDPADMHIGKLGFNGDKNLVHKYMELASDLIARSGGFGESVLVVGNDCLHVDSPKSTTTKGTYVESYQSWHESYLWAKRLYVNLIEKLMPYGKVNVIFNHGNHDHITSWTLAESLESWFKNTEDVEFYCSSSPRKYFLFGSNLLVFTHGDGAHDKDIGLLAAHEAPGLWGKSEFRYAYMHHFHSKQKIEHRSAKDYTGFTVEYLRSPSVTDRWHLDNGYLANAAMEAFIHDFDKGQIARLTEYV